MNLILAAGTQKRWNETPSDLEENYCSLREVYANLPDIKQLIVINDEMIIKRMQRQFFPAQVITKTQEIKDHSEFWFDPKDNRVTIETLLSTKELWLNEYTTVLLGDVHYGRKTAKKIIQYKGKLMFWGDKNEIYAFKFHKSMAKIVELNIKKVLMHQYFDFKFGKLWNLYRMMHLIDFRQHRITKDFTVVADCTDFDTKQEYMYFHKMKVQ